MRASRTSSLSSPIPQVESSDSPLHNGKDHHLDRGIKDLRIYISCRISKSCSIRIHQCRALRNPQCLCINVSVIGYLLRFPSNIPESVCRSPEVEVSVFDLSLLHFPDPRFQETPCNMCIPVDAFRFQFLRRSVLPPLPISNTWGQ